MLDAEEREGSSRGRLDLPAQRCWAARGCQRGMVVKASGCAGQGILILAWLETRDHFNPFALRASEDFPVDVDRPT